MGIVPYYKGIEKINNGIEPNYSVMGPLLRLRASKG
jgi:hypothetical protein